MGEEPRLDVGAGPFHNIITTSDVVQAEAIVIRHTSVSDTTTSRIVVAGILAVRGD